MLRKPKYSYEQWCIDNDRKDLLDRWDYPKNGFGPSEIGYKSEKMVWFKCPRGLHESELHSIISRTRNVICSACNSFAQHVIDQFGADYLDKIWSDKNEFSPWDVSYGSSTKVILNSDNGQSREIEAHLLFRDRSRKSPNDELATKRKSLGTFHPEVFTVWSDKNENTPYDYCSTSDAEVWWRCENGVHEDFPRKINSSRVRGFRCPRCGRLGTGLIDLTGKVFGELTVIGFDKSVDGVPYWLCNCSCGNKNVSIRGVSLRIGQAKTCGDGVHYCGENNPNWKGGEKTLNQRIRSSAAYRNWRDAVINKYNELSVITGKVIEDPELHHIYPMSLYPELMSEEWNTIPLDGVYHNMYSPTGFHNIYGAKNNTPGQLNEFINKLRKEHGIDEPFDIFEYIEKKKIMALNSTIPKPDYSMFINDELKNGNKEDEMIKRLIKED